MGRLPVTAVICRNLRDSFRSLQLTQGGEPHPFTRGGTRLATPKIETRDARPERRAESDDKTLRSILQIIERMDQRLAALEADVRELKADFDSIKVVISAAAPDDSEGRLRDQSLEEFRLLRVETFVDRRRPFALTASAGYEQTE